MRRPLDLLRRCRGREVEVVLKDGATVRGRLVDCDNTMNLVIEGAQAEQVRLGRALVRGSHILYIKVDD